MDQIGMEMMEVPTIAIFDYGQTYKIYQKSSYW